MKCELDVGGEKVRGGPQNSDLYWLYYLTSIPT